MTAAMSAGIIMLAVRRHHPFFGLLFLLLILVLVVLGVVLIVRLLRSPAHHRPTAPPGPTRPAGQFDSVLNELRLRYARGEISREEYLRRAADLGYGPEATAGAPGPSGPPTTPWTGGPPG